MDANIDSYTQAIVDLTREEIAKLKLEGIVTGMIWRTTREAPPERMPLTIRASARWYTAGIPEDKPYEQKTSYLVEFPKECIDALEQGKSICTNLVTVKWRSIELRPDYARF